MLEMSREKLRLLFMREGKLAAPAWSWLDDSPPDLLDSHSAAIVRVAGESFLRLSRDDQDMVLGTYLASARSARSPEHEASFNKSLFLDSEILTRAGLIDDTGRDDTRRWSTPIDDVAELIQRFVADPSSPMKFGEVRALYSEIGRLSGPLWLHPESDEDFPELPNLAINALHPVIEHRWLAEESFDSRSSTFAYPTFADKREELVHALLSAMDAARGLYFANHPRPGRLPDDPQQRQGEERRRAADRGAVIDRAKAGVDAIVLPILESFGQHAEKMSAAETADVKAKEQQRRIAGRVKPEPQHYGVSRAVREDGQEVELLDDGTWRIAAGSSNLDHGSFRGVRWGTDPEQAKLKELTAPAEDSGNLLAWADLRLGNLRCDVVYLYVQDVLVRGKYLIREDWVNENRYLSEYEALKVLLRKKYGEPESDDIFWSNTLWEDDPNG